MRLNFRQGIVSHQPGGFLLLNAGNVDLLANNVSVTVTIADRASNYTHTEDATVASAWTGPFVVSTDYWLYWDFDTLNFTRTFGVTTLEPLEQPTIPPTIAIGQMWFDTTNDEMFVKTAAGFTKVFRVIAARYNSGTFFSHSQDAPLFTGTQIGDTSSVRSGRILFTEFGNTIRRDDGTFFTTEDEFFTNQSQVAAIRLEANVSRAKCTEAALAAFSVVKFSGDGLIATAQYNDTGETVIAMLTEDLINAQVGSVLTQGTVTNPAWDYSALGVGTFLYVLNGGLTQTDPHVTDSITNPQPQVPVARVLSRDTIIFEQGLGGVGPRGPVGFFTTVPPAGLSFVGGVELSVASATPLAPVVVGTNDPRLAGSPFASLSHVHPATDISFTPSGNLVANNAQDALTELEAEKLAIAGGTMTGTLILNADPNAALEAATKAYVDARVFGLTWLGPISFVNLVDDSINDPPVAGVSDVYIVGPAATGVWTGLETHVVQWDGTVWIDHGLLSSYAAGTRFGVSMESGAVAGGTFVGKEDYIFELLAPGVPTWDAGTAPVHQTAVLVNNSASLHAFHTYVYDGVSNFAWVEIGGAQPITVDGLTIIQVGNVISTKDFSAGGLVDATTYRGQDLDTVYTPIGHGHAGSLITLTAPYAGTDWGTPAIAGDDMLVSGTVDLAVRENFDKKASKQPTYTTFGNLPVAANVQGMIAEVTDTGILYVSRGGSWVEISVNDGGIQDHDHTIPYDLAFFISGTVASTADIVIGQTSITRTMTIATGVTNAYGRALVAPLATATFFIHKNGVQVGTVVFDPSVSGGLIPTFDFPSLISLAAGDYLQFIAPTVEENQIQDVSITIVACSNIGTCP